jgi:hypothetical protein
MRKCREPHGNFFLFWHLLGGHIQKKTIFASRQPNHVKHLLIGLCNLLNYNFHSLRSPPGDPRVAHCSHFSVRILPPISFFFPLTGISARGPQGRSDTALRPVSHFGPISSLVSRHLAYFGREDHELIASCVPTLA